MNYENILIVFKQANPEALALGKEVKAWLEARSKICKLYESPILFPKEAKFPQMVVVIGGDGTLIGLARNLIPEKTPIFGINLGQLGFLTSSEVSNWRENLEKALSGETPIRSCLTLRWEVYTSVDRAISGWAINEVVIGRGALARLINLDVNINKYYLGLLRCDGVIVCTPVGSSAYAVSAGGSLVHPELPVSCLVPICPFPASVSPLILPENSEYEFKIVEPTQESELTIDGQEGLKLAVGDTIKVKSQSDALFIFGDENNFFEKLGKRGFSLIRNSQ